MDDATQATPPTPPTGGGEPPPATAGDAAFRALALRLLALHVPLGRPRDAGEPQLLVGRMPAQWAAELPLPDGARVAGSLVIGDRATVVLDCPLAAEGALEFYRERLSAAGWTNPGPPGPARGGFVHSGGWSDARELYCRGEVGPALWVIAAERGPGRTEVRLELDTFADRPEQSPCAGRRRAMGRHMQPMGFDLMPALAPPAGAEQRSEGGGGGDEQAYSSATLQTDLDLATIGAHYAAQLERAGWARTGAGASEVADWSTWSFADAEGRPWRAVFLALRPPDMAGRHFLVLRVESAGGERPGGSPAMGWTTYGTLRG